MKPFDKEKIVRQILKCLENDVVNAEFNAGLGLTQNQAYFNGKSNVWALICEDLGVAIPDELDRRYRAIGRYERTDRKPTEAEFAAFQPKAN